MRILLLVPILSYDFIKTKNKLRYIFHKLVAKGTYHETLAPYILAALTPSHHDVVVKEARYEEIDFDEHFDLVGISCTTTDAPLVYKIVREFRKRGTKVILGGWHPSALPKEAKQHADSVVIGEAEEIWPTILRDAEMQRLKPFYRQRKPVDPEAIPVVTIHSRRFLPAVQATRGCPFQCNFCAERLREGKQPACVEACDRGAMIFGDLNDENSEIRKKLKEEYAIVRKPAMGTHPNIYYII